MAGNILNAQKFFENGYGYSTTGGIGLSTNSSGQRLIDCSGLVYQMERAAGYNVPRFGTGDLLDASGNIKPGASRFYQQINTQDVQAGDILVFANDGHTSGHAAVYLEGTIKDTSFTGNFFGAQNSGIQTEDVFAGQYWSKRTVLGVIRPRADRYDPALDQTGHNEVQLTPTAINSAALARQVTHLTDPEFDVFRGAVASIEAKGHENDPSGWTLTDKSDTHWGRYQMGKLALIEAGFMDNRGNWIKPGINSKEDFLSSPEAQDEALRNYADKNADWTVNNNYDLRIGETLAGNDVTRIGLLMSEHHERGSTAKFMNSDGAEDKQDANGVGPGYYLAVGAKATRDAGLSDGELNAGASPIPFTPSQNSPLTGRPYSHDTYPGDGTVTRNADDSVTYSGTATADSAQGIFFKGDRTSQTYDANGKLIDVVIYDKTTGLPRDRFAADSSVENLEALSYLGPDGAEYRYVDGFFVNMATGESRESLPVGVSQTLPANITSWNIPQADDTTILYERLPGGDWKLTHLNTDGQIIDTTQSLTGGGWVRTSGDGNVLDGYTQDGVPVDPVLAAMLDGYQQGSQSGLTGGTHYADARGMTDVPIEEADVDVTGPSQTNLPPITDTGLGQFTDSPWEPIPETTSADQNQTNSTLPTPSPETQAGFSAVQSALGLVQSLQNGNVLGIVTNGISTINNLSVASGVAPPLGGAGQALGLIGSGVNLFDALDRGDGLGALAAGSNLAAQSANLWNNIATDNVFRLSDTINLGGASAGTNAAYDMALSEAGQAGQVAQGLGVVAGVVGLVLAIDNGDPVGIVSSALSLATTLGYLGPWGAIAAVVIVVLNAIFGDDDTPPEITGHATAAYDETGHLVARIDSARENKGDGATTAVGVLQSLLDGIEGGLPAGFALVPQRLPDIGFQSQYQTQYLVENPDGTFRHFDAHQSDQIGQGYLDRLLAAQAIAPELAHRFFGFTRGIPIISDSYSRGG